MRTTEAELLVGGLVGSVRGGAALEEVVVLVVVVVVVVLLEVEVETEEVL
jgi:hypothetical protein